LQIIISVNKKAIAFLWFLWYDKTNGKISALPEQEESFFENSGNHAE
jgi:hypothetical protein